MATNAQAYVAPAIRIQIETLSGLPAEFEKDLAEGRRVEFVRGNKVVGEMQAPAERPEAPQSAVTAANFDWEAQRRRMWGDRVFDVNTTQWIREDRDARG